MITKSTTQTTHWWGSPPADLELELEARDRERMKNKNLKNRKPKQGLSVFCFFWNHSFPIACFSTKFQPIRVTIKISPPPRIRFHETSHVRYTVRSACTPFDISYFLAFITSSWNADYNVHILEMLHVSESVYILHSNSKFVMFCDLWPIGTASDSRARTSTYT